MYQSNHANFSACRCSTKQNLSVLFHLDLTFLFNDKFQRFINGYIMGFLLIVLRNPKTFKTQFSTLLYCVHVTALT